MLVENIKGFPLQPSPSFPLPLFLMLCDMRQMIFSRGYYRDWALLFLNIQISRGENALFIFTNRILIEVVRSVKEACLKSCSAFVFLGVCLGA